MTGPARPTAPTGPAGPTGVAADEVLVGFTRALGRAGLAVSPARTAAFLDATAALGLGDARSVYWAGRATLCSSPADLARYDAVFARWFDTSPPEGRPPRPPAYREVPQAGLDRPPAGEGGPGPDDEADVTALASAAERLRQHDIATLSAAERARLASQFASLRRPAPRRRTRRRRPDVRGAVHPRRTLALQARMLGEPGRDRAAPAAEFAPVASCCCSTSAGRWRRMPSRSFAWPTTGSTAASPSRCSPWAPAPHGSPTRCATATPSEPCGGRPRSCRTGLAARASATRSRTSWTAGAPAAALGARWSSSSATAGSATAGRSSARRCGGWACWPTAWSGPARTSRKPGYEPVQQGIVAAWPHIDDFVAGHSLRAFDELAEVVTRA